MASVEKKAFPRVYFDVEVEYKIISSPEKISDPMIRSKDTSEGGITIAALERLDPYTMLALKFLLPGSRESISATARVVWIEEFMVGTLNSSKAYEAGVEFVSISKEDREKINQFVLSKL
jgi:c-di-GMP-binding flagellar brake protein YcgR